MDYRIRVWLIVVAAILAAPVVLGGLFFYVNNYLVPVVCLLAPQTPKCLGG